MNKKFAWILFLLTGCGVKGVPVAPLVPAPIGRGEPVYSGTKTKAPVKNKYNYKTENRGEENRGVPRE